VPQDLAMTAMVQRLADVDAVAAVLAEPLGRIQR
jgi:hypothetical protein